jgi:hypothetical protein
MKKIADKRLTLEDIYAAHPELKVKGWKAGARKGGVLGASLGGAAVAPFSTFEAIHKIHRYPIGDAIAVGLGGPALGAGVGGAAGSLIGGSAAHYNKARRNRQLAKTLALAMKQNMTDEEIHQVFSGWTPKKLNNMVLEDKAISKATPSAPMTRSDRALKASVNTALASAGVGAAGYSAANAKNIIEGAKELRGIFGKGRFYKELMKQILRRHGANAALLMEALGIAGGVAGAAVSLNRKN